MNQGNREENVFYHLTKMLDSILKSNEREIEGCVSVLAT